MPSIHTEAHRSPMFCRSCRRSLSKRGEFSILNDLSAKCSKCNVTLSEYDIGVKVLPSSGKFLKIGPTRESYWYHSTRTERWDEKYSSFTDPIYLGTRNAAVRRFKDVSSTPNAVRKGWIYKVKLKPKVKIHRSVLEDDHVVPEVAEFDDQVVRYVNLFESVGSISLIARPEHFEIVSRAELTD